jgi:hypothetical protein
MAPWNWKLVLCLSLQAAVEAAAAGDQRENVMGQKGHGRSAHGPRDLIVFNFVYTFVLLVFLLLMIPQWNTYHIVNVFAHYLNRCVKSFNRESTTLAIAKFKLE